MRFFILHALAAATLSITATAQAGQPAYVGKWGKDAAQCARSQETSDAPMIVRRGGYDSHETHCVFSNAKKTGNSWTTRTICTVEGDKQVGQMTLSVSGKTLTVDGNWKLKRCP